MPVKAGKSELQKHASTIKHNDAMKTIQGNKNIATMLQTNKNIAHTNLVKKAEMKLSAFFAANNVALTGRSVGTRSKRHFPRQQNLCRDGIKTNEMHRNYK